MGIYLNGIHISRKLSTEKGNYAQRTGICARFNGANTMLCAVASDELKYETERKNKNFLKRG